MALQFIVFDCDGVIFESMDMKAKAFYRIGAEFSPRYGEDIGDQFAAYHRRSGGISRYEKFAWLYDTFVGRPITDDEKKALGEKFVDYALDAIATSDLVPGVADVLRAWHGRVPLYVASGAPEAELRFLLEKRALDRYFAGIRGYPPGKRDLLREIVAAAGVPAADGLMVGDSSTDMYAAEAVGMPFYGRGAFFAHSGYPWHDDLTRLDAYLHELHETGMP